jgi:hypothetical protein
MQSVLAAVLGAIALLIFSGLVANLVVVQVSPGLGGADIQSGRPPWLLL